MTGWRGDPNALRVDVDNQRCQLYGICHQEAPEVFHLRGDRPLAYTHRPSHPQHEAVLRAARRCPMRAIIVSGGAVPARAARSRERVVVVGAGMAGVSSARRLRERGFVGDIVLVGEEPHPPYDRTALSTSVLAGSATSRDIQLPLEDLDVRWRLGVSVRSVDLGARAVELSGGERLRFDGLVVATGVEAAHPAAVPLHSPRVHTLRTLDDAISIRAIAAYARRVAIVGDGVLGAEVAATLRQQAREVVLIGSRPGPLHRVVGQRIGTQWLLLLHDRAGVRLLLDNPVRAWQADNNQAQVLLADGQRVSADLLVVAVGGRPVVHWLRDAGLDISDGVLCSPSCHVLGPHGKPLDGVVAAGDVARWPNTRFDAVPRRVEHWINAIEMGEHAADALLAGTAGATPFHPVPRFWSEQFSVRVQVVGMPELGLRTRILAGSFGRSGYLAEISRELKDGAEQVVAAIGIDQPQGLIAQADRIGSRIGRRLTNPVGPSWTPTASVSLSGRHARLRALR